MSCYFVLKLDLVQEDKRAPVAIVLSQKDNNGDTS